MSEQLSEQLITYTLEDRIALIGLNRPQKRNAINDAMVDQLRTAVLRAGDEADVGVLFGHGGNFSAGLALAEALKRATCEAPRPRRRERHN